MAFDVFMKIDVIPGECTDEKHKDWIELSSFTHGLSQASSGSQSTSGARSAERTTHQDFTVSKATDKATAKLALLCSRGDHIKEIKIECCRATGDKQPYMNYVLSDSIVSAVNYGGAAGGGELLPSETVSFNYGKIDWTYTETDHQTGKPKGVVKANWDLVQNKGG